MSTQSTRNAISQPPEHHLSTSHRGQSPTTLASLAAYISPRSNKLLNATSSLASPSSDTTICTNQLDLNPRYAMDTLGPVKCFTGHSILMITSSSRQQLLRKSAADADWKQFTCATDSKLTTLQSLICKATNKLIIPSGASYKLCS